MDPIARPSRIWKWLAFALLLYTVFCAVVAYYSVRDDWRPSGMLFGLLGRYSWVACAVVSALLLGLSVTLSLGRVQWAYSGRELPRWWSYPKTRRWPLLAGMSLLAFIAIISLLVLEAPKNAMLRHAAARGNSTALHISIWLGANPNQAGLVSGSELDACPLAHAAAGGHLAVVKTLLPMTNVVGQRGLSALTAAVRNEHWEACTLLLQAGVTPTKDDTLQIVKRGPFDLVVQFLKRSELERRSSVATKVVLSAAERESSKFLDVVLANGLRINGGYGRADATPLDLAVDGKHEAAASRLKERGGQHSLLYAHEHGLRQLDSLTLRRAEQIHQMLNGTRSPGWSSLDAELAGCIQQRRVDEVELLLAVGANPETGMPVAERWLARARLDVRAAESSTMPHSAKERAASDLVKMERIVELLHSSTRDADAS